MKIIHWNCQGAFRKKNAEILVYKPDILIDFNSNQIWDTKRKVGNHTDVVNKLLEYDIHSLYHLQNTIQHGQEIDPTFFLYRNITKPYHLDYCFCSSSFLKKGYNFKIGDVDNWIALSDHLPIFVSLDSRSLNE